MRLEMISSSNLNDQKKNTADFLGEGRTVSGELRRPSEFVFVLFWCEVPEGLSGREHV